MLDKLTAHAQKSRSYAELRWHTNHSLQLAMRKGTLLTNTRTQSRGLSARLYRNGVFGFAALPRDDEDAIATILATATENADLLPAGPEPLDLPVTAPGKGTFDYHGKHAPFSAAERVDILKRLDAAIEARFPSLVSRDLALSAFASEKALANSEGAETYSYVPRTSMFIKLSLQANDGIVELFDVIGGFGELEDYFQDLDQIFLRVDQLYQNLREKAEGAQCEAGLHDVVLDASVAGILAHEAIGHTCEADSVLAGSIAGDCLGEIVASEKITLGDYAGRGPDGCSEFAIHIDDEGTPCEDVTIIEKGVLKNYLHSKETARRLGGSSLFGRLKSSAFRLSAIAMFAVTRGSSLLFGIGSSALPLWDQEDEVAQSGARSDRMQRPAQEPYANSPHPSSREGHLSADWRSSDILLFWHSAFWRAVFQRSN